MRSPYGGSGSRRAAGDVRFEPAERTGDGTLRVHDSGIGLTETQVHELLATIGRSSNRDDLGFARHEFLGCAGGSPGWAAAIRAGASSWPSTTWG